ncbi:ferredoxin reductase family protein [Nocardioides sp. NPDC126508]
MTSTSIAPAARIVGSRATLDRAVRLTAAATLWSVLLLVTYWWEADGGIQDLGSWVGGLTSLGRLSALLSSVLLLAQVILMARVPVLESAFGQDRLARIHLIVGFTSFNLLVAHLVLITWGYATGSLLRWPAELWNLTWTYPGLLLAVAGTVALVMVVVTSVKAARRRIRYESWHLLHLYGYLGAGLALPHQLWTGQEFLQRPGATLFWWSAWGVTVAAVLVFRVGLPLWRSLRHDLRVAAVVPEGPGVVSVHLSGRDLERLRAHSGRFFTWRFLGAPGRSRAHPYSLSAAPGPHGLRITVRAAGDGSCALATLATGSRVLVEGPYGRLSARARSRSKVVLIGSGVGMAPLRSLAEGLIYGPGEVLVLHRFRERPLFAAELAELTRTRGLGVVELPGGRRREGSWVGEGYAAYDDVQVLLGWVPDIAERDVYVCGPPGWTDSLCRAARAAGVRDQNLHVESFGW